MLKLEDLWVGDTVRITATGERGKYLSHKDDIVTITLDRGGRRQILSSELESYEPQQQEPDPFPELKVNEHNTNKSNYANYPTSIDLHIATLYPELKHGRPDRILAYQLDALNNYLDGAVESGLKFFTIIHGIGTGVLKSETLHILKSRPMVNFTVEANNGGAVEVWLK